MISVAIDGPAGAGKSTLARRLAADFGYIYVDTGAMFRTIGLYALRAGKDPKDNEAVNALLPNITLEFAFIEGEQHIYLNGEDVSTAIRTEEVGMAASAVGANPAVRAFLLEMQRDMAKTQNILMDGRDIGTVVLPNATVKIFLTATPEARATRRWKEYQAKGIDTSSPPARRPAPPAAGRSTSRRASTPPTKMCWPTSSSATIRTPTAPQPPSSRQTTPCCWTLRS